MIVKIRGGCLFSLAEATGHRQLRYVGVLPMFVIFGACLERQRNALKRFPNAIPAGSRGDSRGEYPFAGLRFSEPLHALGERAADYY